MWLATSSYLEFNSVNMLSIRVFISVPFLESVDLAEVVASFPSAHLADRSRLQEQPVDYSAGSKIDSEPG